MNQRIIPLLLMSVSLGTLSCEGEIKATQDDVKQDARLDPDGSSVAPDLDIRDASMKSDTAMRPDSDMVNSDMPNTDMRGRDVSADLPPIPTLPVTGWTHIPFPDQVADFQISFELLPKEASIEGFIGLTSAWADGEDELPINLKLAADGTVQINSGQGYIQLSPVVNYAVDVPIVVTLTVNVAQSTFSADISGSTIADLPFREIRSASAPFRLLSLFAQTGAYDVRQVAIGGSSIDLADSPEPLTSILDADLNNVPLRDFGSLTQADMQLSFGGIVGYRLDEDASVVASAANGNELRLRYKPASNGSARRQFRVDFPVYEEAWLSYRIMFEPGFEVVQGGKLPGLSGGANNSGGNLPTGTDGFSARMMWRPLNKLVVYLYHMDQPSIYGEDMDYPNFAPQMGTWYTIRQRIVMNKNNARNGIVQTWIDGVPMTDRRNIRYRSDDQAFGVDTFYFSTFYGGNDPSWAPSKDTFIRYDDFKISTGISGVD